MSRVQSLILALLCLAGILAVGPGCADVCPDCKGEKTTVCTACGGAGYIAAPPANGLPAAWGCTACGGVRGDPYNGPPGSPGTGRISCPTCTGTGEVEHKPTPEEIRAREEADAACRHGLALLKAKEYDKAIAEFEKALRSWPDHEDAKAKLGEARALKEKHQKLDRSIKQSLSRLAHSLGDLTGESTLTRADGETPGIGGSGLDIFRENEPITDPQIAGIMRKLNDIEVPEPLSPDEALIEFSRVTPDDLTVERVLTYTDQGVVIFNVSQLMLAGKALGWVPTAVLSTGKTFIAGQEAADLYLLKKGAACERALRYLRDDRTAVQFANIVHALRQKKPLPRDAKPQMVSAAEAIVDPSNGQTGTRMAWNSLWSPEAKRAMLSRATIEIGMDLIARGTEGMVSDLIAARDPAFKSALEAIEEAQKKLNATKDPAARAALEEVIKKADTIMVRAYQAGAGIMGNIISGSAAEKRESGLGRMD